MKHVKIILITVELAAIFSVIYLAFTSVRIEAELFKSLYICLCTLLAVVMQKEQQSIEWEDEKDEKIQSV